MYFRIIISTFQRNPIMKRTNINKVMSFMFRKATCLHLLMTHFILFKNNSLSHELFILNFRAAVNYIFLYNGLQLSTLVMC